MVACLPSKGPLKYQLMGPAMETDDRSMKGSTSHFELMSRISVCLALNRPGLPMVGSLLGHPLHNGCSSFPRT